MLKNLSRTELVARVKTLAAQERRITVEILQHLAAIESRHIHLEAGFSSLHEFCVKELGYSDGSAWRRVQAMRLMRQVPEVETQLASGTISMSVAAKVGCATQKKTIAEKRITLEKVAGMSERECERMLELPKRQEELVIAVDEELKDLLAKFKESTGKNIGTDVLKELLKKELRTKASAPKLSAKPAERYIPATLRREVIKRDSNTCQYKDPLTGRACQSERHLEIDHKRPYSLGGRTELGNLRLLCRAHHALETRRAFGS